MKIFHAWSLSPLAALALALSFVVPLAGPLAAQELGKGLVWAGQIGHEGGTRIQDVEPLDVPGLQQAFAEVELHWQTSRDLAACDEMVNRLWLRVNDQRAEQVPNLLYQVFSPGRARYLLATGRPAEAKRALDQVLLPLSGLKLSIGTPLLMPAPEGAVEEAESLLVCVNWRLARQEVLDEADAAIAAQAPPAPEPPAPKGELERLLEELPADRRAFLEASFGLPGVSMDREVQRMVAAENFKGLVNLGLRAAPSLALRVLHTLEDPPVDLFLDPLEVLFWIDPEGAVALMDAFFAKAPESWRFQLVEILQGRMEHSLSNGMWRGSSNGWPTPPSKLTALVAKLLRSDRMRPRALPLLHNVASGGAMDDELRQLAGDLALGLRLQDAMEVVGSLLDNGNPMKGTQGVWERLIDAEDRPELRRIAAKCLALQADASRLAGAIADPDPLVRREALKLLHERQYGVWDWSNRGPSRSYRRAFPEINEAYLAMLDELLSVDDEELLETAQTILLDVEPEHWRPEWFERVRGWAREDLAVANALMSSGGLGERRESILLDLAANGSPEVRAKMDRGLNGWDWHADGALGTRLLEVRWQDRELPYTNKSDRNRINSFLIGKVSNCREGAAFTLRHALATEDRRLVSSALAKTWNQELAENPGLAALRLLLPEERFRLLDLWSERHSNLDPWEVLVLPLLEEPGVSGWIADLAAPGAERSLLQRTAACRVAVQLGHPDAEALCLALLREPRWTPLSGADRLAVEHCDFVFPDPDRQARFLQAVLSDPAVHEDVQRRTLAGFDSLRAEAAALLAERVLSRWPEGSESWGAIQKAVAVLAGEARTPERSQLLERAAAAGSLDAVEALSEYREAQFIPAFVAAFQVRSMDRRQREQLQRAAIEALTGIGSDDAAVALAEALLWAESADVRADIQSSLAALRQYREELSYWRSEGAQPAAQEPDAASAPAPTRESALQELLAMLRDEDGAVRAEAAKALAAFQVLESVPTLIRLLKDEDEAVRAAAREALDRLQAGPARSAPPILF